MDKQARAGYMLTLEGAMKFWERRVEAEKALGQPLTREESENLLRAMQIGEELTFEDSLDIIQSKKVPIVHGKSNENL